MFCRRQDERPKLALFSNLHNLYELFQGHREERGEVDEETAFGLIVQLHSIEW